MPQAFLERTAHFLSVQTTIYLLFKYYSVDNRQEQRYFFQKRVMYELIRGLFI